VTATELAGGYRVRIDGSDVGFGVAPGERLLAAARRAGVWLPFECGWGSCGRCKVALVEGETVLLEPGAPAVDERDARRRRVLACQSTPSSDLVVRPGRVDAVPSGERPVADYAGVLVSREVLGPEVARFGFRLDRPATFRPGQHAILDLGDGVRRCYSMANLPDGVRVDFIAKRYPGRPGSGRLFALELGAEVPLELPYGDMFLRDRDAPIVLVAGGTGVSAMLALLRQLAAAGDARPVTVFYGARTREELVCFDELRELTDALGSAELVGALGEPPDGWPGVAGFVTDAVAARLDGLAGAVFYVAGPPVMTTATVDLLRARGVQLDAVHYDAFG
jgi:toluene monooxygenase electron transfer component